MNEVNKETETQATKAKKGGLLLPLALVALLVLAAGAAYFFVNQDEEGNTNGNNASGELNDRWQTEGEGPVARVDGTEISREQYRAGIQQFISQYASQGTQVPEEDTEAIQQQVLNTLINRQLVIDAAQEANITTDDATIEAEYQNVISSFGDEAAFQEAIEANGVTEAELRSDLAQGVLINAYLETIVDVDDITVSEEEISNYYETAVAEAGEAEIPSLEEVRDTIRQQIVTEKQQAAINAEIERLRAEANVEVLI